MIDHINHNPPLGKSHHHCLCFKLSGYSKQETPNDPRFIYHKGDFKQLRNTLKHTNWEHDLEGKFVDDCWEYVKDRVLEAMDMTIPKLRPNKNPKKPPWMTRVALISTKDNRVSYEKYMTTQSNTDYNNFTKARKKAKSETRKAVKNFEKLIAREVRENPKAFYRYARSKQSTKQGIPDLIKPDGSKTTSDKDKANTLNNFFSSVYETLENLPSFHSPHPRNMEENIKISPKNISTKLSKLKISKSPGPDGIHPRVFHEARDELALPLSILYSLDFPIFSSA